MNTLKLILWSAACATTLAGCDLFVGGQARERHEVVEERPVVVEQRPVIVEPRREVIVEPAPAPIVDVHVR